MEATTIDQVVEKLEGIVSEAIDKGDRVGYFAALYLMVTKKVREETRKGMKDPKHSYFQNPKRMEDFDVIFANRYLAAYDEFRGQKPSSEVWEVAFEGTRQTSPIVLQQLVAGMDAHILFDLGIAAAELMEGLKEPLEDLYGDFKKINVLLASLTGKVERELATIWPPLKWILKIIPGRLADFLADIAMKLARNDAWDLARSIYGSSPEKVKEVLDDRDSSVSELSRKILYPKGLIKWILSLIRRGEEQSVSENILTLGLIRFGGKKTVAENFEDLNGAIDRVLQSWDLETDPVVQKLLQIED